jgi:hypothetical protein
MSCLSSIPDVVWAALGGSGLTLLGVFVQLRHDAKQRNNERQMRLRRDVYLPAAEQLTATIGYVAKLPNVDLDNQGEMEPISGFMSAAAKINIIGSNETIAATNALVGKVSSVVLQLMPKKLPLVKLKHEIKVYEKIVTDCEARTQRALADMRALNFSKESDQGLWKLVKSDFERAQQDSEKYRNELATKWDQYMKLFCDMLIECVECSKQIQDFITPALIAIRKELRLPFDQEQYRKLVEQVNREGKQAFDNFVAELKKDIKVPKA